MMRLLALCTLPRTNPGDRFQYVRANGPWRLTLATTGEAKLPYMGTCRGCCSRGSARKRSAASGPRNTRAEHPVASRRGTREIRRRADVRREFSRICCRARGTEGNWTRVDRKMLWSPAASSSQQRARVLTDVKARRFAPPPLCGADGLDVGSAHGSSSLALADNAHSYTPYMLWSPSCPE